MANLYSLSEMKK